MKIEKYSSGVKWESVVGYSRAIRIGNIIEVSGTTATDENGNIVGVDDPYRQTVQAITNIASALQYYSIDLQHVYRTRIYVTNIDHWQAIGKGHLQFFGDIRPTTTMVEVNRFISEDMLVEIEAQAYFSAE